MRLLDFFRRTEKTASIAKDRLQIIVARERAASRVASADYLPKLQQELLQVIAKYEKIDLGQVSVSVDRANGCDVLELNIVLGGEGESATPAKRRPATPALAR